MKDKKQELLIEVLERFQKLCTHCGECCKDNNFFLIDLEAHVIYKELHNLGGFDLVQKHLRFNPHPWGRFTRFQFYSDGVCPFHHDNRCSIYSQRPSKCKLYPLAAIAFVDLEDSLVRQPVFTLDIGLETYSCREETNQIIERIRRATESEEHPDYVVASILDAIAIFNLDEIGFVFYYGQERESGRNRFHPESGLDTNMIEVLYMAQFIHLYGLSEDVRLLGTMPLTKKHCKKYLSEKGFQKSHEIHKKRAHLIEKHDPFLFKIHKDVMSDIENL